MNLNAEMTTNVFKNSIDYRDSRLNKRNVHTAQSALWWSSDNGQM